MQIQIRPITPMCMKEQMKQNASKVHQVNFCWRRNLHVYKRNESNKSSILLNYAAVKLGIVMTFIEASKMKKLFILNQNESKPMSAIVAFRLE